MADLVNSLVSNGREERNVEFKRTMNWSDASTKSKVVKSSMAMANLRDGGFIVFGVERQPDDSYVAVGMASDDYDSFRQDDVSMEVNNYADPFIELIVQKGESNSKLFVVLEIREFFDSPVICKRDGADRLRTGAIYTRPRRKIETAELPSQVDLREILELAVEKKIRALYSQIERVGARIIALEDSDAKAFAEQLGDL
ncbi:MAG TPA: ATP-binding protein [Bryobacteraceae bacterium]|jgi:predicted HTH transcriptional regulator